MRRTNNITARRFPQPADPFRCDRTTNDEQDASDNQAVTLPSSATTNATAADAVTNAAQLATMSEIWATGDPFADDSFSDDGNSTFPSEDQRCDRDDAALSARHPCLW